MLRKLKFYKGLPEEEIIKNPAYMNQSLDDEGPNQGAFSSERDLQDYLDEDLFQK